MCNLSQGYYENGFKKGFEEGLEEGRQEAFDKVIIAMLKNNKTSEGIAKFMDINIEKIKEIESQLEL